MSDSFLCEGCSIGKRGAAVLIARPAFLPENPRFVSIDPRYVSTVSAAPGGFLREHAE